jgi:uncharacterized protein with NRDE domain
MCLIVFAWKKHPGYPLIVAANRDEFHARPASPAAFWVDRPNILAGRDLEAMGTWMGVSRSRRFAAVTNYRGAREPSAKETRGALVTRFLEGTESAERYVGAISGSDYSGFNLLACDGDELWWLSNRDGGPRKVQPGIHALGNLLLDSAEVQPISERARPAMQAAPGVETLFSVLKEGRVLNERYGTRCSTVLLMSAHTTRYAERSFAPDGGEGETLHYEL